MTLSGVRSRSAGSRLRATAWLEAGRRLKRPLPPTLTRPTARVSIPMPKRSSARANPSTPAGIEPAPAVSSITSDLLRQTWTIRSTHLHSGVRRPPGGAGRAHPGGLTATERRVAVSAGVTLASMMHGCGVDDQLCRSRRGTVLRRHGGLDARLDAALSGRAGESGGAVLGSRVLGSVLRRYQRPPEGPLGRVRTMRGLPDPRPTVTIVRGKGDPPFNRVQAMGWVGTYPGTPEESRIGDGQGLPARPYADHVPTWSSERVNCGPSD